MSIPLPIESASERSGEIQVPERRRHERVPVGLRVVEMDGDVSYFQYATNLSESGMFLEGAAPRDPGARMTLAFIPPGSRQPAVVPAEVVGNLTAPRRGLQVRLLDDESSAVRTWLREYVRHRRSAP
jgi:hypothetical protein